MTSTNVPATPKVSFHELQSKYQADVSALNEKHGAFFAFSDKQIAEQANDELEYCQYDYGGLVGPVGGGASYRAESNALFDAFTLNVRENVDRTAFIKLYDFEPQAVPDPYALIAQAHLDAQKPPASAPAASAAAASSGDSDTDDLLRSLGM